MIDEPMLNRNSQNALRVELGAGGVSGDSGSTAAHGQEQSFLDSAFAEVLRVIEEGGEPDVEAIAGGRTDLMGQIAALIEVARGVAIGPRMDDWPEVPEGYTILGTIGRGGMGCVYLARQDRAAGRVVALKTLSPALDALGSASGRERLRRECEAVASLEHRHIVRVYDVPRLRGTTALAMEYVDGGSMMDVIRGLECRCDDPLLRVREMLHARDVDGPESDFPRLVARWGVQIADALHAVHSRGLLHRDVKPSNILIRRDGTALLSDFGLVRNDRDATLTTAGGFAGTPAYSPPEQLRGVEKLDARADLYALGAALYHALTLRRPYAGDSAVQVLHRIESGPARSTPPRLSGGAAPVPRDLETIVRKALDPERSGRYASAADLAADLARFLEDRPISARPASVWTHAAKFARRHRGSVWTGVVAILVAGLVFGGLLLRATVLPRWSAEAVLAARSAALPPSAMANLFNLGHWHHASGPTSTPRTRIAPDVAPALRTALRHYDRAIFYGDSSGATLAERDAVACLIGLDAVGSARPRLPMGAPVLGYLEWFFASRPDQATTRLGAREALVSPISSALGDISGRDLRQIALISYVLSEPSTATAAWTELERRGEDDAFAAGILGVLYLLDEKPALAYARLQRAVIAMPRSGDILIGAASAAVECGDPVRAEQLLTHARLAGNADAPAVRRVQTLLRFDAGAQDEVIEYLRRDYASGQKRGESFYTAFQMIPRLERLGKPYLALEFAVLASDGMVPPRKAMDKLLRLGVRYWLAASDEHRRVIVREALDRAWNTRSWLGQLPVRLSQAIEMVGPEARVDPVAMQRVRAELDAIQERYRLLTDGRHQLGFHDANALAAIPEQDRDATISWLLGGAGDPPAGAVAALRRPIREAR